MYCHFYEPLGRRVKKLEALSSVLLSICSMLAACWPCGACVLQARVTIHVIIRVFPGRYNSDHRGGSYCRRDSTVVCIKLWKVSLTRILICTCYTRHTGNGLKAAPMKPARLSECRAAHKRFLPPVTRVTMCKQLPEQFGLPKFYANDCNCQKISFEAESEI